MNGGIAHVPNIITHMITPDKLQELQLLHEKWLQDPITRHAIHLLDNHSLTIIDSICTQSQLVTPESDKAIRNFAVQLNKTRTIIKLLNDTPTFLSLSSTR